MKFLTLKSKKGESKIKKEISIKSMSCNHCVMAVKNALSELQGVNTVDVDLEKSIASVDVEDATDEQIIETIEEAGYEVVDIK